MVTFQVSLAGRYLWGRKLRTFLTTLAIVFATLLIFTMNTMLPTMLEAFQVNMLAASGKVDLTITHITGEAFSRKKLNPIKNLPGVRTSAGSLSRIVNIPDGYYGKAGITALTLTGIDPKAALSLRPYPVKEGRFLRSSDEYETVISTSLAENLTITVGDELHIPTAEGGVSLEVVGLLPARTLPGNEELLITLYEAQKLFDLPERINTIEVNYNTVDDNERAAIQANIETILGDEYSLGGLSSGSEMLSSLQMGQAVFNLFGFLALFMGGFIIFNTFRTIIAERRHDIGMLRSIGASRGTIRGLILIESILLGTLGSLIGMGLGYLLAVNAVKFIGPIMADFLHIEMGGIVVQPSLVIMTLALGIGVTLLSGLLPAISASRVSPLEALRPVMSEGRSRRALFWAVIGFLMIALSLVWLTSGDVSRVALGGFLFLIGLILIAPVLVKPITSVFGGLIGVIYARQGTGMLAQSNLKRQTGRAAITASATMIGLAVIVAMGGLVWSLTGGFLNMLQRSLGSDYLIMPPAVGVWKSNVGARQDLADRLRSVPGVEMVSTMRYAASSANNTPVSLLAIDPEVFPKVASLTFVEGSEMNAFPALAAEPALIANGIFAAQAGLKLGDIVRLSTPTGQKNYRIAGVAGDYINAKINTAYISQDNLYQDFRKNEDIFIQVNLAPDADQTSVEERMQGMLVDYPQFQLRSGQSFIDENKQLFDSIYIFYFFLLGILVLPSLVAMLNTLAIGVIERTREIGMLRAIGATRRQISRTILTEALLLGGIGIAFGLLAGLYMGYVFVLGLGVGGFPVEYSFPYVGMLAAAAVGIIFSILAALLPSRQAARMDIIRAIRQE